MIETYIYKTLISFVALNCVIYITKDNWNKLNPKKNGFIKRNFNKLVWCLIPCIRWIWVASILILGMALGNEEFYEIISEKIKEDKE